MVAVEWVGWVTILPLENPVGWRAVLMEKREQIDKAWQVELTDAG